MNPQNNRDRRSKIAHETLAILEQGFYVNRRGEKVSFGAELSAAIRQSRLYRPDDLGAESLAIPAHAGRAAIQVTAESSLGAAERLIVREQRKNTVCLNFASAKNPGGGFLGGSQAQEESLARASGLYPCIAQMEEMYLHNRQQRTCFYSDYMIYSPLVPVIRDQTDGLLEQPYLLSFVTAPAVNAGVVREREPENVWQIEPVMKERIRKVLRVSAIHGNRTLILGAYGCGVFRNQATDVADYFAQVLLDEGYAKLFDEIVFAIYDKTTRQENLRAFKERFA
ncbi:TIGR02452 family protein [Brevibacillus gelatini]|uniref:TIGR02452 family protein n=1 Tax=Brevibacillus gelatini TaxID=1655277 RepID=UPI003D818295